MRVFLRLLLGLAMVAVVIGAAWALRWWSAEGGSRKRSETSADPAVALGSATLAGTNTAGEAPVPASASKPIPPSCLELVVVRSEVSATGTTALVRVRVRVRNTGPRPVRVGAGSFWLLDAGESPHFDVTQREQPQAEPVTLEPGQAGLEFAPKFMLSPYALLGSLTLLAGQAITDPEAPFRPPQDGVRVLVKERGKPHGPFIDAEWKTFTGTRWQ